MLNPNENSVHLDPYHHNVQVDYQLLGFTNHDGKACHFNFSTNLTDEKRSLSDDWDLGIFDCRFGKKYFLGKKRYFLPLEMGTILGPKYCK